MSKAIDRLVSIMDRLRAPDGCPWDREQDLQSLSGYLLEEAYEVVEAVDSGELPRLREELGDLLLQIVFMSKIGVEEKAFDFEDVAEGISEKMIRRHPHVFREKNLETAEEVSRQWEEIKTEERREKPRHASALDGVPKALPALLKAYRITQKAAGLGFDWERDSEVIAKLREEVEELEQAILHEEGRARISSEMGDILFTMVNLSRRLKIEPETALQGVNRKFQKRFSRMEALATQAGKALADMDLEELNRLWDTAKSDPFPRYTRHTPGFDWLIFDADGTLFDYEAAESQALSLSLRAFSLPDTKDSHELYRHFNAALWDLFEQDQISSAELRLRRFEQLLDALEARVDPTAVSARYLEELGGLAPLLPGAQELIEELAPRYGLALATNGIGQVQRRRIAISGLEAFFSAIVISDEIGVAKPSPEYFKILFQQIGNPDPNRVLMVGDSLTSDIKGGRDAGIFTCWLNPSGTPNLSEIRPDAEISELREVHRIIRETPDKTQRTHLSY